MRNIVVHLLLLFVVNPVIAQDCVVRDITGKKSKEDALAINLLGYEWMRNALVCRMGEFEIAAPAGDGPNSTIFVFKNGKPVFYRDNGETRVYSPKQEEAKLENILVSIGHGNEQQDIERLWYETIGKQPTIHIDDTNFDGQPDIKAVWQGSELIQFYRWDNGRWLRKELKK